MSRVLLQALSHVRKVTAFQGNHGTAPRKQDQQRPGALPESPQDLLQAAQSPPSLTKVFQDYRIVLTRNIKKTFTFTEQWKSPLRKKPIYKEISYSLIHTGYSPSPDETIP